MPRYEPREFMGEAARLKRPTVSLSANKCVTVLPDPEHWPAAGFSDTRLS